MPSLTDIDLPKPKDWQAFERLCADLWRHIWSDPNTQMNGRSGQQQHGVDVWGRPNEGDKWVGVQCKGRNSGYDKHAALTIDEVKAEIENAEKFTPGISSFIVATTAPNDAALQSAVNTITAQRLQDYEVYQDSHFDGLGGLNHGNKHSTYIKNIPTLLLRSCYCFPTPCQLLQAVG